MLLSVVGACTQIPSDVILPRGRRNHVSPHTRLTMVLFILIPKQITGVAIPLLHGVVVITSETTTTLHMQDRVATICASNIVIFPTVCGTTEKFLMLEVRFYLTLPMLSTIPCYHGQRIHCQSLSCIMQDLAIQGLISSTNLLRCCRCPR